MNNRWSSSFSHHSFIIPFSNVVGENPALH